MKYVNAGVADGSITEAKLADNAVARNKIQNSAVNGSKIANSAVTDFKIAMNAVGQFHLNTTDVSLAGAVGAGLQIDLALVANVFWPMLHTLVPAEMRVTGHGTDSPGANNPRLGLRNTGASSHTYDLDYRRVIN